jgi:DNA-binding MarR family transcriptional regulator
MHMDSMTRPRKPPFQDVADQCIGVRVRVLNRVLTSVYDDALRPTGLRTSQFNILAMLGTNDEATPRDLEEVLCLEQSTVSRNLAILRRNGWVDARPDESDHRALVYRLSPAGHEKMKEAMPLWRRAQKRAREVLGELGTGAFLRVADHVWGELDERAPTRSR